MAKIKVVQIALAMSSSIDGTDESAQYLDDQGRVWYQESKWVYPPGATDKADRTLLTEWKRLELPEEPQS